MIKIEEVRELPLVGNWYRPPAHSTLIRLTKADLIVNVQGNPML